MTGGRRGCYTSSHKEGGDIPPRHSKEEWWRFPRMVFREGMVVLSSLLSGARSTAARPAITAEKADQGRR